MPKDHIPSFTGGDVNDKMGHQLNFPISELINQQQVVKFRDQPLRSLHGQETNCGCESAQMLNGSLHFDHVYGCDALPRQLSHGETCQIVTSLSQYALHSVRRSEEAAGDIPCFGSGGEEGLLGQRLQAYHIQSSRQDPSTRNSPSFRPYAGYTTGGNLSVTARFPSLETMCFGTARFVPPPPPTSPPTSPPSTKVVGSVIQPFPLLPPVDGRQVHRQLSQPRSRFSSDGHFSQDGGLRLSGFGEAVLENAASDDEDAFEEDSEQMQGAEKGEGELVLPPPAEPVVEPAPWFQPGMRRRCSF